MTNHGGDDLLDIDRKALTADYYYTQQTKKISISKTRLLSILDGLDVECAYSIL